MQFFITDHVFRKAEILTYSPLTEKAVRDRIMKELCSKNSPIKPGDLEPKNKERSGSNGRAQTAIERIDDLVGDDEETEKYNPSGNTDLSYLVNFDIDDCQDL